jgi:hypothetical protein
MLSVLYLHVVLKVDNPMGTGLHLLASDVEQHTVVVPSMLGLTKATVNLVQLMVLLSKWMRTAAEDGILMLQPLNLTGNDSGTLLVHRQTRTLLDACPGGVVLKVEQVLCVPGQ